VDTGSSTLAVAGSSCTSCGTISPTYTPGSGAVNTGQLASSSYGDGTSWDGKIYQGSVSVAAAPDISMRFVEITFQNNSFFPTTSACATSERSQGILGFSYQSLAVQNTDSYFPLLVQQNNFPNVFSLQMCTNHGRLWLGGYDDDYMSGPIAYTPITQEFYYGIDISDMTFGGVSLGFQTSDFVSSQGTKPFVDSGTTLLKLPTAVFNALQLKLTAVSYFTSAFSQYEQMFSEGLCTSTLKTESDMNAHLPQFTIVTGGETLKFAAIPSYLVPASQQAGGQTLYCLGFQDNGVDGGTVLGWAAMNQFVTVFDIGNNRIGFAPQQYCNVTTSSYVPSTYNSSSGGSGSSSGGGGGSSKSCTLYVFCSSSVSLHYNPFVVLVVIIFVVSILETVFS